MSENRTVVYTPDAGSGSGSGMMAMLAQISNDAQTRNIQAFQAQTIAPVNAALSDLSARLAKIECRQ